MSLSPKIAAILAGGKSRRFDGQDKGEIIVNGERLIDIIHSRLKPQASHILISGPHDYGLGFDIVPDFDAAPGGPVGGIYSIWKNLQSRDIEGFFTVAIDGPNVPQNLTDRLYASTHSSIAVDRTGRHPTYGWWRMRDLANTFHEVEVSQSISLNKLADLSKAKELLWPGDKTFININRTEDLEGFVKSLNL